MRIPRKAIYIKAIGLTDTSAFKKGDMVHFLKIDGRWIAQVNGEEYLTMISAIRKDNYFKILEITEGIA